MIETNSRLQQRYRIRLARVAHAEAIHQLLWSARNEIPLKDNFNTPAVLTKVREWCEAKALWMIENAGAPVGAMYLYGNEIFYLVVAQSFQRRGLARRFIAHAKSRLLVVRGRTKPENAPVIALLQSEGFCVDRTRDIPGNWICWIWEGPM